MAHVSLFESVPNFSEGRRDDVISAIVGAAQTAYVLDRDSDPDHNRVVVTLAGDARQLADALVAATEVALRHIDVPTHQGVHPRVGAADVIPIVPLESVTRRQEPRASARETCCLLSTCFCRGST